MIVILEKMGKRKLVRIAVVEEQKMKMVKKWKKRRKKEKVVLLLVGIGVVMTIWLTIPEMVAWPWFVLIGSMVTFAVGWSLGRRRVV